MNCRRARFLISLLVDGELPPALEKPLEAHLGRCEACAEDLDRTRRVSRLLSGVLSPGAVGVVRLSEQVSAGATPAFFPRRPWNVRAFARPVWAAAGLAAAAAVAGLLYLAGIPAGDPGEGGTRGSSLEANAGMESAGTAGGAAPRAGGKTFDALLVLEQRERDFDVGRDAQGKPFLWEEERLRYILSEDIAWGDDSARPIEVRFELESEGRRPLGPLVYSPGGGWR